MQCFIFLAIIGTEKIIVTKVDDRTELELSEDLSIAPL